MLDSCDAMDSCPKYFPTWKKDDAKPKPLPKIHKIHKKTFPETLKIPFVDKTVDSSNTLLILLLIVIILYIFN